MKEHPILFSGDMVRAILDGRKTQTRRVIKPQPELYDGAGKYIGTVFWAFCKGRQVLENSIDSNWPECLLEYCPYGAPGDRPWVRETWGLWDTLPKDGPDHARIFYRATDFENPELRYQLWRPSIFMPRWASRITLEIINIRVERLQDINPQDCLCEGIEDDICLVSTEPMDSSLAAKIARQRFEELWNSINAKRGYSWDSNPWVWVIEFKVDR